MNQALSWLLLFCIVLYRNTLRLLFPRQCCFSPSCSVYAEAAIRRHGPAKGVRLAIHRLLRCHPWAVPAVDPVP